MLHSTPQTIAIHNPAGTPVKKTNGLLCIQRRHDHLRRVMTGSDQQTYFVYHVPTGCRIAGFKTKREAATFAAELFAKLTLEQWQSSDVDLVGGLLLQFKPWIKAENDRRWS